MGRSRGGLIGRLADEFDLAWQRHPQAIEVCFRTLLLGDAAVLDATGRRALLEELIKVDLEYRWKPSPTRPTESPWTMADYTHRFPELQADDFDPTELVAEEFRARWTWGDRPARARYIRAYPQRPGPS